MIRPLEFFRPTRALAFLDKVGDLFGHYVRARHRA
jgi:hypothetical protein